MIKLAYLLILVSIILFFFYICGIKDIIYKRYFAVPFVDNKMRKRFLKDVRKTVLKI